MVGRSRRSPCGRGAASRISETIRTLPLFPEDDMLMLASTSDAARQEQVLREAITPYLSLADLRRLAASGEDVHAALSSLEPVPEAVRGLLALLCLLLTPSHD